ncbi:MAG: hypothetical protein ACTSYS_17275, partial [Promethearchaeota archaeon]
MDISNPLVFGFYFIEVFLDWEIAVFFFIRWKQEKTEKFISQLGLAYLFFGFARFFLIQLDFFNVDSFYYNCAAMFAFLAMSVFANTSETMINILKYRILTIMFVILAIASPFLPTYVVRILYYIFSPIMITLVIIFLCLLMAKTVGKIRFQFRMIFYGFILYGAGYGISAQFLRDLFLNNPFLKELHELLIISFVLGGLTLVGLGFMGLSSLSEIHWENNLLHVYVFHINSAACIHDEQLFNIENMKNSDPKSAVSPDLFSSGVVGIIGLIKEMVQSEKRLKVVDHEDKKIILEYGDFITVALVVNKDLKIY